MDDLPDENTLTIPNNIGNTHSYYINTTPGPEMNEPIISLNRVSFRKLYKIIHLVRLFIHNLKLKVHKDKPNLFFVNHDLQCLYSDSCNIVIKQAQVQSFSNPPFS